jgi:hypothetical protein
MTQVLGLLVLSTVRCFCITQKQKGVDDAMIEAHFLKIYIIPTNTLSSNTICLRIPWAVYEQMCKSSAWSTSSRP